MRRISFAAKDIFGKDLGKRTIVIGSSTGNTFSSETVNNNKTKNN